MERAFNTPRALGPLLVALGAGLWATDSVFRVGVVQRYPALFIVFFNHWLCLFPALPTLVWGRRSLTTMRRRDWAALAFVAACGSVVAMVLFTQSFATASNYTVPILMQKLQPLAAILLARLILKERTAPSFPLWAGLALAGAYLVSFGWTNAFSTLGTREAYPVLLAVAAAALWGATTVAGRLLLGGVHFLVVTAARFAFGSVFAFAAVALTGQLAPFRDALTHDLGAFLGMAFLSGLLPLLIYYYGLRTTPASVATLCELAFPLAAIVINWVLLGSPLTSGQLAGAALLLTAITALTLANARASVHQPP